MNDEQTHAQRPFTPRPKHLWYAWEATVGYIHSNYNANATLRIMIHPLDHYIGWDASLTWGADMEKVTDKVDFSIALMDLWTLIDHNHHLMQDSLEAQARRPVGYADDNVLDMPTYEVFSTLVNSADTVFQGDWQILITYRPIETASKRVQTRLTADKTSVIRAGNGPTLREACRDVLRHAAPVMHKYRNKRAE